MSARRRTSAVQRWVAAIAMAFSVKSAVTAGDWAKAKVWEGPSQPDEGIRHWAPSGKLTLVAQVGFSYTRPPGRPGRWWFRFILTGLVPKAFNFVIADLIQLRLAQRPKNVEHQFLAHTPDRLGAPTNSENRNEGGAPFVSCRVFGRLGPL